MSATFAEQDYARQVDALKRVDADLVAKIEQRIALARRLHEARAAAGAKGPDPYEVRDLLPWLRTCAHSLGEDQVAFVADFIADLTEEALA